MLKAMLLDLRWSDLVDILATAGLIYSLLLLIRGTRAVQILTGLLVLGVLLSLADVLNLVVVATLLRFVVVGTAVTLPIVFQPELRRALESLGRGGIFGRSGARRDDAEHSAQQLASAAFSLSAMHVGGLIAIEVTSGLQDIADTGTRLDAKLSSDLITTIFSPKAPLHDGAVIVRGNELVAASCVLPLAEGATMQGQSRRLGTRHRAALGLSEQTDAVIVVVSEETGNIVVARGGKLSRIIDDEDRLRKIVLACSRPQRVKTDTLSWFHHIRERLHLGQTVERRA